MSLLIWCSFLIWLHQILTLEERVDSSGETQEERQGKMLLHTEYSLLSLLHNQDGVVHHHGLFQVDLHTLVSKVALIHMKGNKGLCFFKLFCITQTPVDEYSVLLLLYYHGDHVNPRPITSLPVYILL